MVWTNRDIRLFPLPFEDPIENSLHHPACSLLCDRIPARIVAEPSRSKYFNP